MRVLDLDFVAVGRGVRRLGIGLLAIAAPPLPFTYMGRLKSGNDVAVFLTQGERNLVVREGETIDSSYRVERIAEGAITLTYLPLNEPQTLLIAEPQ